MLFRVDGHLDRKGVNRGYDTGMRTADPLHVPRYDKTFPSCSGYAMYTVFSLLG